MRPMQKASSCLLLGGGLLQRGDRRRQDLGLLQNARQTIRHTSTPTNQVQQIKVANINARNTTEHGRRLAFGHTFDRRTTDSAVKQTGIHKTTNLLARNHQLEAVEVGERGAGLLRGELLCPGGGGPLGGNVGDLPGGGQGGLTANVLINARRQHTHTGMETNKSETTSQPPRISAQRHRRVRSSGGSRVATSAKIISTRIGACYLHSQRTEPGGR
jgi:hypothetical protein